MKTSVLIYSALMVGFVAYALLPIRVYLSRGLPWNAAKWICFCAVAITSTAIGYLHNSISARVVPNWLFVSSLLLVIAVGELARREKEKRERLTANGSGTENR